VKGKAILIMKGGIGQCRKYHYWDCAHGLNAVLRGTDTQSQLEIPKYMYFELCLLQTPTEKVTVVFAYI
jgi:hypothetical protein